MSAPTPGYLNSDEKTWALLAHFGGIVVGFIAGLVALLVKGSESATVRAHAIEALNFQITWGIAIAVSWVVAVCAGIVGLQFLFILPLGAWAVLIIFSVMAGLKANEGQLYKYPASLHLVK